MGRFARPKLLLLDELTLGLAPAVVSVLLRVVQGLVADGVTVILVEQSVDLALQAAHRAYFMEKGEVRYEGPTEDLLQRPDLLRSIFFSRTDVAGTMPARATTGTPRSTDGAPRLEVRGVTKHYGGIAALDHVSFDVASGEILGILGPNGAGKTTLFDVISGFERAESGHMTLRDGDGATHRLDRLSPVARAHRGLGRSFQDGRLFPALTVEETVAVALEDSVPVRDPIAAALHLPAVYRSEAKVKARVDELIAMLGLESYRDKFVRELSTGTRRVVDVACVVAHGPRVLLLDEPSSGIAQREAEALAPLLRRVRDELGASLVVIEHDLLLLRAIADRLLALDLGRVIAVGDPEAVVADPAVLSAYLGGDATSERPATVGSRKE
jgi:branched-chain amino acid transport system ATP-binding protein